MSSKKYAINPGDTSCNHTQVSFWESCSYLNHIDKTKITISQQAEIPNFSQLKKGFKKHSNRVQKSWNNSNKNLQVSFNYRGSKVILEAPSICNACWDIKITNQPKTMLVLKIPASWAKWERVKIIANQIQMRWNLADMIFILVSNFSKKNFLKIIFYQKKR
mgnify:CR=1 FL=1